MRHSACKSNLCYISVCTRWLPTNVVVVVEAVPCTLLRLTLSTVSATCHKPSAGKIYSGSIAKAVAAQTSFFSNLFIVGAVL